MLTPVCFMVTPFGTKAVGPRVEAALEKIDFDALWNKAYLPVIKALGCDLVSLLRDCVGWSETIACIDALAPANAASARRPTRAHAGRSRGSLTT